ncbi:glycosyl hydrolase [Marinoscillum sp. MHG1-6]|uniref:glycosyl hydrolase n=1 Tax=Marinoscillum sp. MHG1-6 TaxID=2959627 RepID=UPI00215734F6|nr:glycosyl hydrolase [Marinoscillum sp. MHG1-6]
MRIITLIILSGVLGVTSMDLIHAQTLKHSYTFDEGDAQDIIGNADGIIHGGIVENGRYSATLQGNYIELPADKININQYTQASFEAMIQTPSGNAWNTMLFYFGRTTGENYGADYLFFSPKNGGTTKVGISCLNSSSPWTAETNITASVLEDNELHHIVLTLNNSSLTLYIDGSQTGSVSLSSENKLENISNLSAYLCKGGYTDDPTWLGSIDQFNIYEGILSAPIISNKALSYFSSPELIATTYGNLDSYDDKIKNLSPITVQDFLDGLTISKNAEADILDSNQNKITDLTTVVNSDMTLRITGSAVKLYQLVVRPISDDNYVKWAFNAEILHGPSIINDLYNDLTASQFLSGVKIPSFSSIRLLNGAGTELEPSHILITKDKVEITAENGDIKTYQFFVGSVPMTDTIVSNSQKTFDQLPLGKYELQDNIEWYILDDANPIPGSKLNLTSENIWIYFPNVLPQTLYDKYFPNITINGQAAVPDQNVRLVQHGVGSVIIGHPSTYQPLTVYSGASLTGDSKKLSLYTYYKEADAYTASPRESLGTFDNNIESFLLKKGYMASFSENTDGTGASKVYIADEEDIVINTMETGLVNTVSFIRVFPWRWVNRKGYVGNAWDGQNTSSQWVYCHCDQAGEESSLNVEYVPLKHNPGWPGLPYTKKNVTNLLYYNEPDNSVDDGYSTVADAISNYPALLATGLRMVSPAPTDGGVWWLEDFLTQCKANNYRVDAVAIHFYLGCQSTQQFYHFLNGVHEVSKVYDPNGLPVWITEFNNGCNWSDAGCKPTTYEQQEAVIKDWVDMLEDAPFVERYSIWPGCEQYQQFWMWDGDVGQWVMTPAGEYYSNKRSGLAYTSSAQHDYHYFPENNDSEVISSKLSWVPKPASTGQQLYFGMTSPPEYFTQLEGHIGKIDVGPLEFNQKYYWRIDEYQSDGTIITGQELEFTTYNLPKASDPIPSDGSTLKQGNHLGWSSDPFGTETHQVYLSRSPNNMFLEATFPDVTTSFVPDALTAGETYYWRVDEVVTLSDGREVTGKGDIWSFTATLPLNNHQPSIITVYPNPARDLLYINGIPENTRIEVYDLIGHRVISEHYEGQISISQLKPGIYILHLGGAEASKFIVE